MVKKWTNVIKSLIIEWPCYIIHAIFTSYHSKSVITELFSDYFKESQPFITKVYNLDGQSKHTDRVPSIVILNVDVS